MTAPGPGGQALPSAPRSSLGDIVLIRFGWLRWYLTDASPRVRESLLTKQIHPGLAQSTRSSPGCEAAVSASWPPTASPWNASPPGLRAVQETELVADVRADDGGRQDLVAPVRERVLLGDLGVRARPAIEIQIVLSTARKAIKPKAPWRRTHIRGRGRLRVRNGMAALGLIMRAGMALSSASVRCWPGSGGARGPPTYFPRARLHSAWGPAWR